MFACSNRPTSSIYVHSIQQDYTEPISADWSDPHLQALIDNYKKRKSIFTIEQLKQKIYETTGFDIDEDTLSNRMQEKPSNDQQQQQKSIREKSFTNRKNIRIFIVELESNSEFEICGECTALFRYLQHPKASFALKILDESKNEDFQAYDVDDNDCFYEMPDNIEYSSPEVFYVEENDNFNVYMNHDQNLENKLLRNIEQDLILSEHQDFDQPINNEEELPPRLFPEGKLENVIPLGKNSEFGSYMVVGSSTHRPHNIVSLTPGVNHEKILDFASHPETSNHAEFLLSKNHTPTLLTVPCSIGYVRQYRLSCDKGAVKYYRCSRCDYICRKLHLKLKTYVKVKNGQILTDTDIVEHHPSCLPIPALQAIAKDIDRKCRLDVKKKRVLPKNSYNQGLENIMKMAAKKNLNMNTEKLHSYFPTWNKVRVQYRRLLSKNPNENTSETSSFKFLNRTNKTVKKRLNSETMFVDKTSYQEHADELHLPFSMHLIKEF